MSETSFIQERKYQTHLLEILQDIQKSYPETPPPVLVELDCGMGKRVLSYLLVQKYFPGKKTLILLQASSSLQETADFFINRYQVEVGVLTSRIPSKWRINVLKNNRIILATPQTLANTIQKFPEDFGIEVILVNEVDKILRRTATRRNLVFPYPFLLARFSGAWIIGLSGTLRDNHLVITDQIRTYSELYTLAENLPGVRVISMEEIIASDENIEEHIIYTELSSYAVKDDDLIPLFQKLDQLILDFRQRIIDEARREGLIEPNQKNLALIAGQLAVDSKLSGKYNALLMLRKYLTGMLPVKYKKFLSRFPEFKAEVDKLPDRSSRIQRLPKIIEKHFRESKNRKVVIMVSYVYTGEIITKYLSKANFSTFMISGIVKNKAEIINAFRDSQSDKSALIMTQVGERDLDIPEAKLIIVYDTINTPKTMYQRFKRTRGGKVVCLFYENTSDERKVKRLFNNILEKYPWSVKDKNELNK